jgi:nucleoside-diphosphate-sugar epimerase
MKKILVTGSNTGLGKFLKKHFLATGFSRKTNFSKIKKIKWDLVVHCAFNTNKHQEIENFDKLINDNLVLSHNISQLSGKKIFISSCSVYENIDINQRSEEKKILIKKENSNYSKLKILCEKYFNINKDIIIRSGSIIGVDTKKNTIQKILIDKKPNVYLSRESLYSFITHQEILDFIKICIKKDLSGVYNLLRNDYIKLGDIAKIIVPNKKIQFGKKKFSVIKAKNKKSRKILKYTDSTIDVIKEIYDKKK